MPLILIRACQQVGEGRPRTMYNRFTDRARHAMQHAEAEAQRRNHLFLGTQHLLLGLINEGSGIAAAALKNFGVDLNDIRRELEKRISEQNDDLEDS